MAEVEEDFRERGPILIIEEKVVESLEEESAEEENILEENLEE